MNTSRRICAFVAASGLAVTALGQTTRLVVETSQDGVSWMSGTRFVAPGSTVLYRYQVSFDANGTTASPIGLASLTFQPVIANPVLGQDVVAPFADVGNNSNGGGIVLDASPLDGPFGRIQPFAATGPQITSGNRYEAIPHSSGSGGAPAGNYLRIARNDITRWVGLGPTSGTAAANNFNGAGGVACVQKGLGLVSPGVDPPFRSGISNVTIAQFALSIDSGSGPRTLAIDAPLEGMSRNSTTGARQASWFASSTDNFGTIRGTVAVIPAQVTVVSSPWNQRAVSGPSPRSHHAMAYDAARGETVLFGGWTDADFNGETWKWNGAAWTQQAVVGPSPRWGHAMAYDAPRGATVLFGGLSGSYDDETWEWNGTAWTQRLVSGPSPRYFHAMAYDAARGVTVLFGGSTNSGSSGETWEWNGTTWSERVVSGPSPRSGHAMAYDLARNVTVLFGGSTNSGSSGETWEWNGTVWTQRVAEGPSPRSGHAMVYDTARNVTFLCAGLTDTGRNDESWEWDGIAWAQRLVTGPSPRALLATAYDTARSETILFGGDTNSGRSGETWGLRVPCSAPFDPPTTQPMAVALCVGQSTSLTFAITAPDPIIYQWRRNGVELPGANGPTLALNFVSTADDGWYDCEASSTCGSVYSNAARVSVPNLNPLVLIEQPVSVSACAGSSATLVVAVTGSGPIAYQWTRNGAPLPDATAPTLSFNQLSSSDGGSYACEVTSTCGTVTSNAAQVTVWNPLALIQQPVPVIACEGTAAELTVAVTGSGPIAYQWRRNNIDLPGATGPTLSFGSLALGDTNFYACTVTNPCGSVTSSTAVVAVQPRTLWTQQPLSLTRCEGLSAQLSVSATGTGTVTYQWYRENVAIAGATGSTLTIPSLATSDAGSYTCQASATCGTITSTAAVITVHTAPTWTQQPAAVTACEGLGAQMSAMAMGTGTITYQWKHDNVTIPGATSPTLSFPSLSTADAGSYTCEATGECGVSTSAAALVTVQTAPTWTQQPVPITVCDGLTAELSALATGTGPLTYQWLHNGIEVPGATDALLAFNPVTAASAGDYTCTATGLCGTITSSAATLTVQSPLAVSQQPESVTDCEGRSATLTFIVTGTEPIGYQWKRNDADIPGGTTASLMIGALSATDAASYTCTATGPCDVLVSDAAVIVIRPATEWTRQPASVSVCEGAPASMTVAATGDGEVTYQWMLNSAAIAGATGATYEIHAASPSDVGLYTCVATAGCGAATSEAAAVTVRPAPTVTLQPQSQSVPWGEPVAFGVNASSQDPMEFQWRRNGLNLTDGDGVLGSTSQTLTIAGVEWSDQGSYDCLVTTECGGAASEAATLSVSSCPPTWASMGDSGFGQRWVHSQAYSGVNGGTLVFGGRDAANNVLGDTWLMTGDGWTSVAITGPGTRTDHAMAQLGNGRVLLFGGKTAAAGSASALGDTWEWDGASWALVATVGPTPRFGHAMAFDSGRDRVVLFGGLDVNAVALSDTWEWTGSNWTLVSTTGPSGRFAHAMAFDPVRGESLVVGGFRSARLNDTWAWHGSAWRLAATGGFSARYYSSMAFDPRIGRLLLFGGSTAAAVVNESYVWDGISWSPIGFPASPSARWTHAMSYDAAAQAMVVSGGAGSGSTRYSDWWEQSGLPIVTSNPSSSQLVPGGIATFSVGVSRTDVQFRWSKGGVVLSDGGRISGSATAMLTITGVQGSDQGTYDCVISNACGTVVSDPAELSCIAIVTEQPQGIATIGGQVLTLTAGVSTGGSTTYRWKKDGSNLFNGPVYSGVLTPTLSINANDPTQSGSYTLTITNACGTTTTLPALVEITCPADFNNDGGIDGSDVSDFFEAWENSDWRADLNFDGGIDGLDVEAFFARWENGC